MLFSPNHTSPSSPTSWGQRGVDELGRGGSHVEDSDFAAGVSKPRDDKQGMMDPLVYVIPVLFRPELAGR